MEGQTIPIETVVRFALRLGFIFAVIFLVAVLTPWMAKKVDGWIAHYRETHDPKRDPDYGIRSIQSAFAVSSILVLLAVIVLVLRSLLEHLGKKDAEANR